MFEKSMVDETYLQYTARLSKPVKMYMLSKLNLRSGSSVIDIGCGPGTDTTTIAKMVGEEGLVVGVDADPAMVEIANKYSVEQGVSGWVEHKTANALNLPFDNETFDSVRSERMLQHISEIEKAVSEMVRVAKNGGSIVVADTDHSSLTIDTDYADTEWKLRKFRVESIRNGFAGRKLWRLFKTENLSNIVLDIFPIFVTSYLAYRFTTGIDTVERAAISNGLITAQDLKKFNDDLIAREKADVFFASLTMIIASGTKA